MLDTLKIIHLLCLYGGGGAALGSAVLGASLAASGGDAPPAVRRAFGVLGKIGLVSIVVIWITGVLMVLVGYGGGEGLGWPFHVKVLGAAVTLAAVLILSVMGARAQKAGSTIAPGRAKPLSMLGVAGTVVAVIFGVIAFN